MTDIQGSQRVICVSCEIETWIESITDAFTIQGTWEDVEQVDDVWIGTCPDCQEALEPEEET